MGKALILGVSGFIGQHLSSKLLEYKDIVGYDLFSSKTSFPVILRNYAEETEWLNIIDDYDIDTVYHMISTTIPKDNTQDIPLEISNNVIPSVRLLEAMRLRPHVRLVFLSSGGTVYGEYTDHPAKTDDIKKPICGYGMQKMIIDEYIQFYNRIYNTNFIIARLANPYGVPDQRPKGQGIIPIFINRLINNEPITVYGNTLRDYIHIDDAVDALIKLCMYKGNMRVFNIGTGVSIWLKDVITLIEKVANKSFLNIIELPRRTCDVEKSILEITDTVTELNWHPSIKIDDGIMRTWQELSN